MTWDESCSQMDGEFPTLHRQGELTKRRFTNEQVIGILGRSDGRRPVDQGAPAASKPSLKSASATVVAS